MLTINDIIIRLTPEQLFSEYFRDTLKAQHESIFMNVFLIGYKNDQGVREILGRSGSEMGPENFRELFYSQNGDTLKKKKISVYDLGDIGEW